MQVGLDASWRDQVFFVRSLFNAFGCPSEPVAMGTLTRRRRSRAACWRIAGPWPTWSSHGAVLRRCACVARQRERSHPEPSVGGCTRPCEVRRLRPRRDGLRSGRADRARLVSWVTQRELRLDAQEVRELVRRRLGAVAQGSGGLLGHVGRGVAGRGLPGVGAGHVGGQAPRRRTDTTNCTRPTT